MRLHAGDHGTVGGQRDGVGRAAADEGAVVSAKKIATSSQIGTGGAAPIHLRTQQMGFVWHNRTSDAGIDGSIKVRNPAYR